MGLWVMGAGALAEQQVGGGSGQGFQRLRTCACVQILSSSLSVCICEMGIIKLWEAVMTEGGSMGTVLPAPDLGQALSSSGQRSLEPPEAP